MAQNAFFARFRHCAAQFAPILIFLSSFDRSQCPLSNEPKILQIGWEMAELWRYIDLVDRLDDRLVELISGREVATQLKITSTMYQQLRANEVCVYSSV